MDYLKQFTIIIIISFIGEILNYFLPLPCPASIYGLVIMFLCLQLKIIKLHQVEKAADFLLNIITLFFIPSTVGLIGAGEILKSYGIQFIIIGLVSTIAVFGITGIVTQTVIKLTKKQTSSNDLKNEEEINE